MDDNEIVNVVTIQSSSTLCLRVPRCPVQSRCVLVHTALANVKVVVWRHAFPTCCVYHVYHVCATRLFRDASSSRPQVALLKRTDKRDKLLPVAF